jgi:hypothetical protein
VYEGCEIMPRKLRKGVMHADGNRVSIHGFQLFADTGGVPSEHHGPPSISGSLPDGYVGDTVDFTYTVTPAYPGQSVTVTAEGLPPGLSMDTSGHVTGTLTEEGEFTPIITAVDDCNDPVMHQDSVTVTGVPMLVFSGIDSSSSLLRSVDGGLTWPSEIDTGGAPSAAGALALASSADQVQRHTPLAGRVGNASLAFQDCAVPSGTGFPMWLLHTGTEWLRRSGGGLQASADGVTFAARTIPNIGVVNTAHRAHAMRGSFIASTYASGATYRVMYSTDAGATWAVTGTQLYQAMVATGNRVLAFMGSSGRVDSIASDGTISASYSTLSTLANVSDAAYSPDLGRIVAITTPPRALHYSDDDGATWTTSFPFPVGSPIGASVIWAHGRFIMVALDSGESTIYTSEDGIDWVERYAAAYSSTGYLFEVAALQ